MPIEFDQTPGEFSTTIKVIGVGGAGGNAVNTMIDFGIQGVEYIVANTDIMDLKKSKAKNKVQLGQKITKGHGTGANPKVGKEAAEESREEIKKALAGADMLFIAAGLGGGTGTGAAPVVAEVAREMDILTLGIFTKPFASEGLRRKQNYEEGLTDVRQFIDSYIVIPNDKLNDISAGMVIFEVFKKADGIIYEAAKAMSDIINLSGYINVDFADVKSVLSNMGYSLMGTGVCEGENRAVNASKAAISNPLLSEVNLTGCKAILLNITVGNDMIFSEFDEIISVVNNETGNSTNTIIGLVHDEKMTGKICVTIFATGIADAHSEQNPTPPPLIHIKNSPTPDKDKDLNDILNGINKTESSCEDSSPRTRAKETNRSNSEEIEIPTFMRRFND
jgi:cell division protein FtsZ